MTAAALIFRRPMHGRGPLPYSDWLRDVGVALVLFTLSRDSDEETFAHVERCASFDDGGRTEQRVLELATQFEFTHVFAQSEHDILRAAELRERLGVPGQSLDSALAYRDKVLMKRLACAAGVRCGAFASMSTPLDLEAFVDERGLPVVVKPRRGAGARGVHVLRTKKDVQRFVEQPNPPDAMVESFVDGNMFHVDGLATEGRIIFVSPSRYVRDNLAYQSGASTGSVLLDPSDALSARLVATTQQVILALPPAPSMAFHAELFLDAADQILLCEIACRPGGSRTADPIRIVYGVDIYEQWVKRFFDIRVALSRPEAEWFSVGRLLVPPRRGRLSSMPAAIPFNWVVDYCPNSRIGQWWEDPQFCADHVASFLMAGRDAEQAAERMLTLDRWFQDRLAWAPQ